MAGQVPSQKRKQRCVHPRHPQIAMVAPRLQPVGMCSLSAGCRAAGMSCQRPVASVGGVMPDASLSAADVQTSLPQTAECPNRTSANHIPETATS